MRSESSAARHAVVTGASGYLGRHLASTLEARGWRVTRCLRDACAVPGAVTVPDLDERSLEAIPWPVDTVFHIAGLAHRFPPHVPSDAEFERVNAHGSGAVARAARNRAKRVVYASSIAAICESSEGRERIEARRCRDGTHANPRAQMQPQTPRTAYGPSKLDGERQILEALAGSTTDAVILRFPAMYGAGAPGAVSQLARWILQGRPLPSCARTTRRSMIAIANAIDACIVAAEHTALANVTATPTDHETLDVLSAATLIALGGGARVRTVPCPRFALRLLGAAGSRIGFASFSSAERLLESTVVADDTLARLAGWIPPVDARDALTELGSALARETTRTRNTERAA